MTRTTRRRPLTPAALLLSVAALAMSSCLPPTMGSTGSEGEDRVPGTGALLVSFEHLLSSSPDPTIDMTPASYVITGRGPKGSDFVRSTGDASAEIQGLPAGVWDLTVEADNAGGDTVGNGTTQVTLASRSFTAAAVKVKPVTGYGTLLVTVRWPAAQVTSPSIDGQLVPEAGTPKPLTFALESGTASGTAARIPAGTHALTLRILDGSAVVGAAIEVVQLRKNATTTLELTFNEINPTAPNVQTNIAAQADDLLTVSLSGQVASVVQGAGFTARASVEGVTGNAVLLWYLNGAFRGFGAAFTIPADLPPAPYRIDVTAFAANGSRAGSCSASFTVTARPQSTTVTLAWDRSVSDNVAGYKLHYGTACGVYESVADVGNVTTFTVTGLQPGVRYYFAATAYSSAGMESAYSNEVSF
jgi:hypothetical protein